MEDQSMTMHFVFPVHFEDLAFPTSEDDRFCTRLVPESEIQPYQDTALDISEALAESPLHIVENKVFDPMYTMIARWSSLNKATQKTVINSLCDSLVAISSLKIDDSSGNRSPNALCMLIFLMTSTLTKAEEVSISTKATESKSKKMAKSTPPNSKHDWGLLREKLIGALIIFVKDVHGLSFLNKSGSSEYLNQISDQMFSSICSLIELADVMKTKSIRELLISFFIEVVHSFRKQIEASNFILQTLIRVEYPAISDYLIETLLKYHNNFPQESAAFLALIIREIGKISPEDLGRDSSASKNISSFISLLGEYLPAPALSNISVLLPLLDQDSYLLRNGIVQLAGWLIVYLNKVSAIESPKKNFESDEGDESQNDKKNLLSPLRTRDSLLSLLRERILDVTSFTRSKVLQVWSELCVHKVLPVEIWPVLLHLAIDRLDDKALLVRKHALSLIGSLLQYNPFGAELSVSKFSSNESSGAIALHFLRILDDYSEKIYSQLSQGASVLLECVHLIKVLRQFHVAKSLSGVKKLLPLALSSEKDSDVRKAIVSIYGEIFMGPGINIRRSSIELVLFVASLDFSERRCMEVILGDLLVSQMITKSMISGFWDIFSSKENLRHPQLVISSLECLAMLGKRCPDIIQQHLDLIIQTTFTEGAFGNAQILTRACVCLKSLKVDSLSERSRSLVQDDFMKKLEDALKGKYEHNEHWYSMAEEGINLIFKLGCDPLNSVQSLIRHWCGMYNFNDCMESIPSVFLAQLFFLLGHCALKVQIMVEKLHSTLCKLQSEGIRKTNVSTPQVQDDNDDSGLEEGFIGNCEEYELESIRERAENSICSLNTLLGAFSPLIIHVCTNPTSYSSALLQHSSTLALCKFMCVSSQFCENNLQLLFTILATSSFPPIRSDIFIALGDLSRRFPNLIDPWSKRMFSGLKDPNLATRRIILIVLSYLILNDIIKVKGEISEITLCLEDENSSMVDLAKHFFVNLSKKGNDPIYNLLPHTINRLLVDSDVPRAKFRSIAKYLIQFIVKERHIESIVDKFCHKIEKTTSMELSREFFFCLSLLSFTSEKSVLLFIGHMRELKERICDDEIFSYVESTIERILKAIKQEDVIREVNDLREQLIKFRNGDTVDAPAAVIVDENTAPSNKITWKNVKNRGTLKTNRASKKSVQVKSLQPLRESTRSRRKVVYDDESSMDESIASEI